MCVCLVLLTSGCIAVLGYEPTPAELEMIRRGEDPRANENDSVDTTGNAGEGGTETVEPTNTVEQKPGPEQGTVLRWMDSATVVVEVDNRREVVSLVGEKARESAFDERVALDDRMNKWTYGTWVRLSYPLTDNEGAPIYRDPQGHLLATID